MLLRELAAENASQVILATHSEVILGEALDHNLTLLLAGRSDDLAAKTDIRSTLRHYGAEHYVRARQRGYVLYVEGGTDVEILRSLARRIGHPVEQVWDERINSFYVQDNFPEDGLDAELAREHFFALRSMVPELRGLALLDSVGRERADSDDGGLRISYWRRYECENYIVTPDTLRSFAQDRYSAAPPLFEGHGEEIDEVLDALILERVFEGREGDFAVWKAADPAAGRLVWTGQTERVKLSDFAEDFFRRLADRLGHAMLLRKGELYRLVDFMSNDEIPGEVATKLDLLEELFRSARPEEES